MSVIYRPPRPHVCRPEWIETWHEHDSSCSTVLPHFGSKCVNKILKPDEEGCSIYQPRNERAGSIYQCECGETFVSLGCGPWQEGRTTSFLCKWRPEGRFERWKRERKAK